MQYKSNWKLNFHDFFWNFPKERLPVLLPTPQGGVWLVPQDWRWYFHGYRESQGITPIIWHQGTCPFRTSFQSPGWILFWGCRLRLVKVNPSVTTMYILQSLIYYHIIILLYSYHTFIIGKHWGGLWRRGSPARYVRPVMAGTRTSIWVSWIMLVALVSYIVFYIIILTISICKQYCQIFRWNNIFLHKSLKIKTFLLFYFEIKGTVWGASMLLTATREMRRKERDFSPSLRRII